MKFIYLISLLLCLAGNSIAQEGTNFEDLTFDEALAKSKQTGKKLFIDCYTKTCGPCKYMVNFIFPLKECGDYFNSNYICIMKDMQEGEGIDIAKKYQVQIYPTYLILNHDGSLFCRMDGGAVSKPEDDFVQKVKNVVKLAEMKQQYEKGERSDSFLKEYIAFLQIHDKKQLQEVLSGTMPSLGVNELCKPENWNLIKNAIESIDIPVFRYLMNNRKAFSRKLGHQEVETKIMNTYKNEFRMMKMMKMNFDSRMTDLKQLEKDNYKGARALRYSMLFRQIINNKQTNRVNEILKVLQSLPQQLPDEQELVSVLQELKNFEQIANQQQLEKTRTCLQEISKRVQPENKNQINRIMASLSKG
ncbi:MULTISPECIES: thioredoxin family protein [Butyricimonas]|uniref:thioredoxin family protein n=1 Tax=Butyricimonas TaxID=574697 RepID=UPI001D06D66D|nr:MULTISPECIES: thioredoxin family protein [Butyricimonas]MCB6972182.1 thioredoxin family protein [Butyricimonas synergistica]MCG4519255.1 thioredoxin family protein [Butyricimonas sp. DFI.6.44]